MSKKSVGGSHASGPPLLPPYVGDRRVTSQINLVAGANKVRTWMNAAWYSAGVPHSGASSGSWWKVMYIRFPQLASWAACFLIHVSHFPAAMLAQGMGTLVSPSQE